MLTISMRVMLVMLATGALASCSFKEGKPRSAYVQGCMASGSTEKVCKCSWDGLKEHYGIDLLAGIDDAGVLPPDFMQIANKTKLTCTAEIAHIPVSQLLQGNDSTSNAPQAAQLTPAQQADAAAKQIAEQQAAQGQAAADVLQGGNSESKTLALGSHILSIKRKGDVDPFVVSIDGKELKQIEAFSVDSVWSSAGGGRTGYALLGINSGGTGCPVKYFLVEVSPEGATHMSPEFGSCSDQITSTEAIPGGVVIKMPDFLGPFDSATAQEKAASRTKTYVWQEGKLSES